MNQTIIDSISRAVDNLIANSTTDSKLRKIVKKHIAKVHFIPIRYRVLGGILQSMNIQFGNFLETTIKNIVSDNPDNEIIEKYSGKKTNKFSVSEKSVALIDQYIIERQTSVLTGEALEGKYDTLRQEIVHIENSETKRVRLLHDIDLLFRQKSSSRYIYAEIKYNDDHDTGKFIDINRKVLLTYALLVRELSIKDTKALVPCLMYFNNKTMKGNIYLPEATAIYRGKRFFDEFTTVGYDEIDKVFAHINESEVLNKKFDALSERILHEELFV